MNHKTFSSLDTQEISLRLEHYDDIFSDFDMRPYGKRALSADFLDEMRRASRDKNGGGIELVLFVPEAERNESHETTIRERLVEHFQKHLAILQKDKRKVLSMGTMMVVLGIICMISATLVLYHGEDSLMSSFLVVFLEPAAWFLLWEGMDQIIFNSKTINPDLHFYSKMSDSNSHIFFESYTK